jgi:hypothetical protein
MSSRGVNWCPGERDIRCPVLNNTSILGLHPTRTLHPGISPCHMHSPQVLLMGKCPGHISQQDSSYVLLDRLDPHHTPKTHAKISSSSYQVITMFSAPRALSTHKQSSTMHHITDIMHSRNNRSSKWASSLTTGVLGNRLRQGKGLQAFLPSNLSQFICIKVKH